MFETDNDLVTLFRPVGPAELKLIEETKFSAFPPRLPDQPIFYPVLTEEYAVKIARDWNVPASGAGYVTRFTVRRAFLSHYKIENAGGNALQEYWIPAEDLVEFNRNIVGEIAVIRKFGPES
ncbi:MAG: ADP-ribosylation/crystallin J1 [Afipia sp.]